MRSGELTLLVALLAGCPPVDDTDTGIEKAPFDCTLGALDADGVFVAYEESGEAELVLGFQGFLFLDARIAAVDAPAVVTVVASVDVGDGEPSGVTQPEVPFHATADGALSGEVLLFLPSGDVAAYTDRAATITARVEDASQRCVTQVEVTLVDRDPCIHTDDAPICPEEAR